MSDFIKIKLPIPDSKLSPNARIHWRKKSRITKQHRQIAFVTAHKYKGYRVESYRLEFTFKDKRRRDRDNASASCKAYLDGISDAIGQDDHEWEFNGVKFNEPSKVDPCVEVVMKIKGGEG